MRRRWDNKIVVSDAILHSSIRLDIILKTSQAWSVLFNRYACQNCGTPKHICLPRVTLSIFMFFTTCRVLTYMLVMLEPINGPQDKPNVPPKYFICDYDSYSFYRKIVFRTQEINGMYP